MPLINREELEYDKMKDIIILLGPPASGKGTQSALLSEKLGFVGISTGSLLRKEIQVGTDLGKEISAIIDHGNLVPDDMMFRVLKRELEGNTSDGFILDGFPRTLKQAEILSDYLIDSQFNLKKVFVIDLDKENILNRIGNRITCKNCGAIYNSSSKKPKVDGVCDVCHSTELINRNDDLDMEAINKRIDIFKANIGGIMSFYEKKSLIFLLDGLKDVNVINHKIIEALNGD